ncbi:hypothetical protein ABZP36_033778 [Zizania latifolia]
MTREEEREVETQYILAGLIAAASPVKSTSLRCTETAGRRDRTAEDGRTPHGSPCEIPKLPLRPSPVSSSLVGTGAGQLGSHSPTFFLLSTLPPLSRVSSQSSPTSMAKTKQGKKDVDSYTIKGTNKVVRVGDCVLMRPSDTDKAPYVARVERLETDGRGSVRVRVRWYYRPEESKGGRRQFHGAKELFLSDHFDTQSAHTIEGKCVVHSFKNYTKLDNVGPEDFFCRFEYKAATGAFTPDRVAVYAPCSSISIPFDHLIVTHLFRLCL